MLSIESRSLLTHPLRKQIQLLIRINMKKIIYFFTILLLTVACESKSKQTNLLSLYPNYYVKVTSISDGDTFKGLTDDKKEIRFRIYAIDAPEKHQAFGTRSKEYLSDLIFGKTVQIIVQKKSDAYKRPVVWVYTPEGKEVASEMLKAGMAWHFPQFDSTEKYIKDQEKARSQKKGLWSDANPIPPWEFRKGK